MKKLTVTTLVLVALAFSMPRLTEPKSQHKVHTWSISDSKAYATVKVQEWGDSQFSCLEQLWTIESHWNPYAKNAVKVMGRHAGGIPQILGMSTKTKPTDQIDRGLVYIYWRYKTPCIALKHEREEGWY
jgi:hypothetical protein